MQRRTFLRALTGGERATSGLFMFAGKRGLFGRGPFFVAAGVAIPLVYLALVKG